MNENCILVDELLSRKEDFDVNEVSSLAVGDSEVMNKLIEGLRIKTETVRFNCEKTLLKISEDQPALLYHEWDAFTALLESKNSFHRCCGLNLLANLSCDDPQKKFEKIFALYFGLLNDEKMIPAVFVARNAGKIMKCKPHLQSRIIKLLLAIDQTDRDPERNDLIKADIIHSFGEIVGACKEKKKIIAFVEKQRNCASPKTRKIAIEFLKKYC